MHMRPFQPPVPTKANPNQTTNPRVHGSVQVVEKLQRISLDGGRSAPNAEGEAGPGMIPNWDYISPSVIYREYLDSPFHNVKSHV
eukprot:scaffold20842_cov33-Tisochrysis_lutea.AAC.10